ncbi:hypothetical protein JTE90_029307 [Oedothorax gibbosus]|uniref:Uncharacterized protein n=1 Tax=Oedothorax gibbosus TaxID=931172 RepID=A0AAV6TZB1_9ARAC|nr:hypothetical protein JTE90_029307 [Oedothorax gibbosus]
MEHREMRIYEVYPSCLEVECAGAFVSPVSPRKRCPDAPGDRVRENRPPRERSDPGRGNSSLPLQRKNAIRRKRSPKKLCSMKLQSGLPQHTIGRCGSMKSVLPAGKSNALGHLLVRCHPERDALALLATE